MAERRAQEAEEEQLKAEAAAAALAQQLADLQREAANAAAAAATAAGSSGADDPGGAPAQAASQLAEQGGVEQQEQPQQGQAQQRRGERVSEGSEAQLARDAEILLAALDRERQRSEELARMAEAAEHEAVLATDRLMKAQQVGGPRCGRGEPGQRCVRCGAAPGPARVPPACRQRGQRRWLLRQHADCQNVHRG